MIVKIFPIEQGERYEVNGKEVYLDSNENWITTEDLTQIEKVAFNNYKRLIIENKEIKKHPKSTFKY